MYCNMHTSIYNLQQLFYILMVLLTITTGRQGSGYGAGVVAGAAIGTGLATAVVYTAVLLAAVWFLQRTYVHNYPYSLVT